MATFKPGDRVKVVDSAYYNLSGRTYAVSWPSVGDIVTVASGPDADGDYSVERNGRFQTIAAAVIAPVFVVGDLATVKPRATYRVNRDERISATGRRFCGQVVKVVHGPDGDGDLRVEGGDGTTFAIDPRSLEPYQAPLFAIAPIAPAFSEGDEVVLKEGARFNRTDGVTVTSRWATRRAGETATYLGERADGNVAIRFSSDDLAIRVSADSIEAPAPVNEYPAEVAIAGIDEDDEPDALDPAMERRADALEMALDLLGDDKSVGEYVQAALYLLGEEVPS